MTLDARPDLPRVTRTLKETGKYAVTHVAVLRRLDGRRFTAEECMDTLTAYQLASSFLLGRFASPALAEARDDGGRLIWREWTVRLADRLGGVTAWWDRTASPIADPIRLLGDRLLDPRQQRVAGNLVQAYVASNRGGFVEQRLSTAFAALELLSWQRAVLEGGADPNKHDSKRTDQRLRSMLTKANVPISVPEHLSALVAFARDEGLGDAPKSVTEVRHRLTHPKSPRRLVRSKATPHRRLVAHSALSRAADLALDWLHGAGRRSDQAGRLRTARPRTLGIGCVYDPSRGSSKSPTSLRRFFLIILRDVDTFPTLLGGEVCKISSRVSPNPTRRDTEERSTSGKNLI